MKVDLGSPGASPEEYQKSGLLLEMTSGMIPWISPLAGLDGGFTFMRQSPGMEMFTCVSRVGGLGCFGRISHILREAGSES